MPCLGLRIVRRCQLHVRLWNVAERKEAHVLDFHSYEVISIGFSSDGDTLALFSENCVRLLDPATGTYWRQPVPR